MLLQSITNLSLFWLSYAILCNNIADKFFKKHHDVQYKIYLSALMNTESRYTPSASTRNPFILPPHTLYSLYYFQTTVRIYDVSRSKRQYIATYRTISQFDHTDNINQFNKSHTHTLVKSLHACIQVPPHIMTMGNTQCVTVCKR